MTKKPKDEQAQKPTDFEMNSQVTKVVRLTISLR